MKIIKWVLIAGALVWSAKLTDYMCVNRCVAQGNMYGLCVKMCSY